METITQANKVVYTGKTLTKGARDGVSKSSDGYLDVKLSTPGTKGTGTNPEQLFAAAWSACFGSTIAIGAKKMKIDVPQDSSIAAEIDLVTGKDGAFLQGRLNVSLPGLHKDVAQQLVDFAHDNCPYSKAIRGNVNAEIKLV
jgi:Ohr subfamily peroxiredoxin